VVGLKEPKREKTSVPESLRASLRYARYRGTASPPRWPRLSESNSSGLKFVKRANSARAGLSSARLFSHRCRPAWSAARKPFARRRGADSRCFLAFGYLGVADMNRRNNNMYIICTIGGKYHFEWRQQKEKRRAELRLDYDWIRFNEREREREKDPLGAFM